MDDEAEVFDEATAVLTDASFARRCCTTAEDAVAAVGKPGMRRPNAVASSPYQ